MEAKGRDWGRANRREREQREIRRLDELGLAQGDEKSETVERRVHPNSMAARMAAVELAQQQLRLPAVAVSLPDQVLTLILSSRSDGSPRGAAQVSAARGF